MMAIVSFLKYSCSSLVGCSDVPGFDDLLEASQEASQLSLWWLLAIDPQLKFKNLP